MKTNELNKSNTAKGDGLDIGCVVGCVKECNAYQGKRSSDWIEECPYRCIQAECRK